MLQSLRSTRSRGAKSRLPSADSRAKARAVQLLRTAAEAPLHPDYVVEDAAAVEDARALLRKWGA